MTQDKITKRPMSQPTERKSTGSNAASPTRVLMGGLADFKPADLRGVKVVSVTVRDRRDES